MPANTISFPVSLHCHCRHCTYSYANWLLNHFYLWTCMHLYIHMLKSLICKLSGSVRTYASCHCRHDWSVSCMHGLWHYRHQPACIGRIVQLLLLCCHLSSAKRDICWIDDSHYMQAETAHHPPWRCQQNCCTSQHQRNIQACITNIIDDKVAIVSDCIPETYAVQRLSIYMY
jgi:hypothetical protein